MIAHHLTEATLVAYAAGTLPDALGIVAATHLMHCTACRRGLATLEAAGGVLLNDIAPVEMQTVDLDALLARADAPATLPPLLHADLPQPLNRVPLGRWWPIAPGLRWRPLHVAGNAWGGLLLAQPGRRLPRHGHAGLELTCVLTGAFFDGDGVYAAGDVSEPDADHDQPPAVFGTQPCLCVIATEGMQFRGLLGWTQRRVGWG